MRTRLEGWPLLALTSSALVAMVVVLLALYGLNEESARVLVRATARTSVVFFCAAIAASALFRFYPTEPTRWLLRNRRQVGLSFGVSHVIHYAAVYTVAQINPEVFFGTEERSILGVATIATTTMLIALIATSFDATTRLLGHRLWKRLHVLGVYFFWGAFIIAFGGRALTEPTYIPVTALLLATFGFRVADTLARHRES